MALKQVQDKREWDNYVISHGGNPLQLWGWGDLKASHNWQADRLFFYVDDEIVGAVQVLIRHLPRPFKTLAYVPRGPIVGDKDQESLLQELAKYVKRLYKSVALSVEPDTEQFDIPSGWHKSKNRILPAETIILDLKKTDSELLVSMAKKTRQYIRKSAAEKTVIKRVKTKQELQKCLDLYHKTAQRAGFTLHSDDYYKTAFNKLEDHSQIFATYNGDQPIAFLWITISAKTAYELYGGMSKRGQELRSNYALKWYVIHKCREWGLTRYDFGGLIDGGVSTFKLHWASEATQLAGTFDKPLSRFYNLWTKALPTAKKAVRHLKGKTQQ